MSKRGLFTFAAFAVTAPPTCLGLVAVAIHDASSQCAENTSHARILATIRRMESGDDYSEHSRSIGNAPEGSGWPSGAYQYLRSTWAGYGGWDEAWLAPPAVQDERAAADVAEILAEFGAVDWVPVVWYIGRGGARAIRDGRESGDTVPNPRHNTLTPNQYRARWMAAYADTGASPTGCTLVAGDWSMPWPADVAVPRASLFAPHHDYPAVDIGPGRGLPEGTPILAVHAGTVSTGVDDRCGVGVRISDATMDDVTFAYCHASALAVVDGQQVAAGDVLGWVGSTGRSTGPHLHFGVRVGGVSVCPGDLLASIADGAPIDPHDLDATSCVGPHLDL